MGADANLWAGPDIWRPSEAVERSTRDYIAWSKSVVLLAWLCLFSPAAVRNRNTLTSADLVISEPRLECVAPLNGRRASLARTFAFVPSFSSGFERYVTQLENRNGYSLQLGTWELWIRELCGNVESVNDAAMFNKQLIEALDAIAICDAAPDSSDFTQWLFWCHPPHREPWWLETAETNMFGLQ